MNEVNNKTRITMRSIIYWIVLISNTTVCYWSLADSYRYMPVALFAVMALYLVTILMSIFYIEVESIWTK